MSTRKLLISGRRVDNDNPCIWQGRFQNSRAFGLVAQLLKWALSKGPKSDCPLPLPDEGNRSSSENVVFSIYLEFRKMDEVQKPCDSARFTPSSDPIKSYRECIVELGSMALRSTPYRQVSKSHQHFVWNLLLCWVLRSSPLDSDYGIIRTTHCAVRGNCKNRNTLKRDKVNVV
jgi:hypothetical protein